VLAASLWGRSGSLILTLLGARLFEFLDFLGPFYLFREQAFRKVAMDEAIGVLNSQETQTIHCERSCGLDVHDQGWSRGNLQNTPGPGGVIRVESPYRDVVLPYFTERPVPPATFLAWPGVNQEGSPV
jgi:hypothetical protein